MAWLLVRPHDEDVVLPGEKILYKERRHWAAVTPELFQFVAVLFLQGAFAMRGTTGMGTVLLFGTVLAIIVLRPLIKRDGWDTWQLLVAAGVGFWAIQSNVSIMGLANLLVLVMGARLAVRAIRWGFYQQTYLTNRRLMEVDGFLGITVNSICPGIIITDIVKDTGPATAEAMGVTFDEMIDMYCAESATKRPCEVEEVASLAVLLASDAKKTKVQLMMASSKTALDAFCGSPKGLRRFYKLQEESESLEVQTEERKDF